MLYLFRIFGRGCNLCGDRDDRLGGIRKDELDGDRGDCGDRLDGDRGDCGDRLVGDRGDCGVNPGGDWDDEAKWEFRDAGEATSELPREGRLYGADGVLGDCNVGDDDPEKLISIGMDYYSPRYVI